jgi:hypothetical protein
MEKKYKRDVFGGGGLRPRHPGNPDKEVKTL